MRTENRRRLWIGGLIYLLLLLGLATLNSKVLAIAIPLAVYLAAALLYGPEELRLKVTRTLSADRVYVGSPVAVHLSLTNEGSGLEEVLVQDLIPRSLELISGESQVLASLSPGETIQLSYTVIGKRGSYDFQEVQAMACDRSGLARQRVAITARSQLSVMPKPLRLRRLAIRPFRTRGYAGPVLARQGGSGTDFFGVREYQPGDPRRRINWRVSARHPTTLFTNEFEWERIADVGLILDARQRTDIRVQGDSLLEYAVSATASLAEAFLAEGNRVGLLVYGELVNWTFPGYGKVQRERILRELARAETGVSLVFEHLDFLPTQLFPAKSQIVLVSPLCQDDLPMLIRLRAHGYQLLVIRPDSMAFERKSLPSQPAVDMAARIVTVERTLLLFRLRQAGIQVVDWQVDRPFDQVLHGALARMPLWSRSLVRGSVP
jgi:uncharacterized protein (DUF58 family)